jgi:hypothetical protein
MIRAFLSSLALLVFGLLGCTGSSNRADDTTPTVRPGIFSPVPPTPAAASSISNLPAVPEDFVIPTGCTITDAPDDRADDGTVVWIIRCADSRHVLSMDEDRELFFDALRAQGWKACGVGLGTAYSVKGDLVTGVGFGPEVILLQKPKTFERCPETPTAVP